MVVVGWALIRAVLPFLVSSPVFPPYAVIMQSLATFGLNRQLRRLSLQQTRFPVSLASSNRFQFDKRRRLSTEELRDEDSDIDTNLAMSMELHDPMDIRLAELVDAPPRKFGKIPPGIKNARLAKMRFYEGKEKNIRGSPWKLNLVCQLAAGLPVDDALKQLTFCDKGKAPLAFNVSYIIFWGVINDI